MALNENVIKMIEESIRDSQQELEQIQQSTSPYTKQRIALLHQQIEQAQTRLQKEKASL